MNEISGKIGEERFHKDTIRTTEALENFLKNPFANKKEDSIFFRLKTFINSKEVGSLISRKDIIDATDAVPDVYRRCMTLLGYIKYESPGVYKKVKNIPKTVTSSHMKYAYKNQRFKFKNI